MQHTRFPFSSTPAVHLRPIDDCPVWALRFTCDFRPFLASTAWFTRQSAKKGAQVFFLSSSFLLTIKARAETGLTLAMASGVRSCPTIPARGRAKRKRSESERHLAEARNGGEIRVPNGRGPCWLSLSLLLCCCLLPSALAWQSRVLLWGHASCGLLELYVLSKLQYLLGCSGLRATFAHIQHLRDPQYHAMLSRYGRITLKLQQIAFPTTQKALR